jgi:hypothetical protein
MVYFNNIMTENKAYFDSLAPKERATIEAFFDMANNFVDYVQRAANARGLDFNKGNFYGEEESPIVMEGRETLAVSREQALRAIQVYRSERTRIWSGDAAPEYM